MSPEAVRKSPPSSGNGIGDLPAPGTRSAEQIRADIVRQRQQLGRNVESLRGRVSELTDVKHQVREHRTELMVGAAAVGVLLAGAVALRRRDGDYD